jgi:hypothetical protein
MTEHYRFVGPYRAVPGIEDMAGAFEASMRTIRASHEYPEELAKTPEQTAAIEAIRDASIRVGAEYGVDLSGALSTPDDVHFFPDEQTYDSVVERTLGPDSAGSGGGISDPGVGILWTLRANPADNASGLAHEYGHEAELLTVQPYVNEQGSLSVRTGGGHVHNKKDNGLRELSTDMWMVRVLNEAGTPDALLSYGPLDAIGDLLVRDLAAFTNRTTREIGDIFIQDKLHGTKNATRLASDFFRSMGEGDHTERMKCLLNLSSGTSFDEAIAIIDRLGLTLSDTVRQKLIDLSNGKAANLGLFEWWPVADSKRFGELGFSNTPSQPSTRPHTTQHESNLTPGDATSDPILNALRKVLGTL